MFTNTLAYNKARIELHSQALAYEKATDEERETLPVGKLIPQEDRTEELWSLLNAPPTPEQKGISLLDNSLHFLQDPTLIVNKRESKTYTIHNNGYPIPELGFQVTHDNIEWFITTYAEWLARIALYDGDWAKDSDGDRVRLSTFGQRSYLPWVVTSLGINYIYD